MPIDFAAVRARAKASRDTDRRRGDDDGVDARAATGDDDEKDDFLKDYDETGADDDDVFASNATPIAGIALCDAFIDEDTARALEDRLMREPASSWTSKTRGRRVHNVGGASPSSLYRDEDALTTPTYAKRLMEHVFRRGGTANAPNHVLVNEYEANAGVEPHSDGACYDEDVAILTLRGRAMIEFWPSDDGGEGDADEPVVSLVLEPRSLLMYRGDAYRLRHGIRETETDVVTRATANARALGLEVGDVIKRNPRGRVSVVFVRKKRAE